MLWLPAIVRIILNIQKGLTKIDHCYESILLNILTQYRPISGAYHIRKHYAWFKKQTNKQSDKQTKQNKTKQNKNKNKKQKQKKPLILLQMSW